ncbi:integrase [Hydrogenovibrio sp. SC-1]|uniref:tyrosine-type recombinase/integrase n=1 Tax=Hydrogenovibrio sp. SC-1 TaxID=2065820 RepID=UPI000C7B806B|nr:DUF3596 domain-containing protein [Hydrogenovibrio sp. SC-1]PLA74938.1 integrase [Hydrogenovibrio sp. SC-1]
MASIRSREGKLFFDFYYRKKRCRELTLLSSTPSNQKKLAQVLRKIEAEIALGTFVYSKYFPNSPRVAEFEEMDRISKRKAGKGQLFSEFVAIWYEEVKIGWRDSYDQTVVKILNGRIMETFGDMDVSEITKADLLQFRARLGEEPGRNGKKMSPSHINRHMYLMRMILREAADRFDFNTPFKGIKALRNNKPDIHPFNLEEVNKIINGVDPWYRYYYTVRFLTGMRTGEIDGLKWKYVDFDNRLIKVRESLVKNKQTYTKNDFSQRDIEMSSTVFTALQEQFKRSGHLDYVFVNSRGDHFNYHNISRRIWHPLLKELGLERRNPYQTRHTAATLWLGAGENPAWIAKQMGHSTTEMLFRVYARYVPNLTRKDGSAMEKLISGSVVVNSIDDDLNTNPYQDKYADQIDSGLDESHDESFWGQLLNSESSELGGEL